jgi:antirestriction protein ArdC
MSKPLSTNSRADIYQRVTDAIVLNLEQGVRPWIKPWTASAGNTTRPLRHDGTPYRGINVLILWLGAAARGYASSTWMTYRQATVLGGQVRKGEHGTTVVYANVIERSDKASQAGSASADQVATTRIPVLRAYTVFNVDQIEGLLGTATSQPLATESLSGRIEHADAFVMASGATVVHRGNRACYVPSTDRIEMPPYGQFVDTPTASAAEGYYATLLHELVHWTSPKHRCDRDLGKRFGDKAYAREELVAEIGAAFLCADLGITLEPRLDHAAYIAAWLAVLKADKRAIFSAAALAQKAVDWLAATSPG